MLSPVLNRCDALEHQLEENRLLIAKLLLADSSLQTPSRLSDAELKVFSQTGEDGIIQYLLSAVPIANRVFVEFGVEDYRESNSRFLLFNNNWRGLVIDGSGRNIARIRASDYYWQYDLTAIESFVTIDNINQLISSNGVSGDIGLLSIDIDGNDYWVWEAITTISPRIVICEYNSVFGWKEPVTVPYSDSFVRNKAHYSNLYFGASLAALCTLAKRKDYVFAGSNSAGTNAFFVRKDVAHNIAALECSAGYVESRIRESRDKAGTLTHISGDARRNVISSMPVVDVVSGKSRAFGDVLS